MDGPSRACGDCRRRTAFVGRLHSERTQSAPSAACVTRARVSASRPARAPNRARSGLGIGACPRPRFLLRRAPGSRVRVRWRHASWHSVMRRTATRPAQRTQSASHQPRDHCAASAIRPDRHLRPCRDEMRAPACRDMQPSVRRRRRTRPSRRDIRTAGGQLRQSGRQQSAGAENSFWLAGAKKKTKLNPRRTGTCRLGQRGSQSARAIQPRQAAHSSSQRRITSATANR